MANEVVGSALIEIQPDFSSFERELTKGLIESINKVKRSAATTLKVDVQLDNASKSAKDIKESLASTGANTEGLGKVFEQLNKTLEGVNETLAIISENMRSVEEHTEPVGKLRGAFEKLIEVGANVSQIVDAVLRVEELTTKFTLLANLRSKVMDFFKGFKESSNDASTASMGKIDAFFTNFKKGLSEASKQALVTQPLQGPGFSPEEIQASPAFADKSLFGKAKELIAREPTEAPKPVTQRITESLVNESGETVTSIRTVTTETIKEDSATKGLIATIRTVGKTHADNTKALNDTTEAIKKTITSAQELKGVITQIPPFPKPKVETATTPVSASTASSPVVSTPSITLPTLPIPTITPVTPPTVTPSSPSSPPPPPPEAAAGANFKDQVGALVDNIQEGLSGIDFPNLINKPFNESVKEMIPQALDTGQKVTESLKGTIGKSGIKEKLTGLFDIAEEAGEKGLEGAGLFALTVKGRLGEAIPEIKKKLEGFWDGFSENAKGAVDSVGTISKEIGGRLGDAATTAKPKLTDLFHGADEAARKAGTATIGFAKSVQDTISSSGAMETVKDKFEDVSNAVHESGGGIIGLARTLVGGLGGAVKNVGSGMADFFGKLQGMASGMGNITKFALGAGKGIGKLVETVGGGIGKISEMSAGMGALGLAAGAAATGGILLAVKVGQMLVEKLSELVHMGFEAAVAMQQMKFQLQGAFQSSAAAASEAFKSIDEFASHSGLSVEDTVQQVIRLKGSFQDFDVSDAQSVIKDVASAAAAMGIQGSAAINTVISSLTEMASRGKISSLELNHVTDSLPGIHKVDIIKQLADNLGLTQIQAQKLADTGGLDASAGILAVLGAIRNVPGATDALAKQAGTFQGAMSGIKSAVSTLLGDAFTPFLTSVQGLLSKSGGFFNAVKEPLAVFGKNVAIIFKNLAPVFGAIVIQFANVVAMLSPLVAYAAQLFGVIMTPVEMLDAAILTLFRKVIVPVTQAIVDAFQWVIDHVNKFIGILAKIPLVGSAFSGLADGAKEAKGATEDLGTSLGGVDDKISKLPRKAIDFSQSLSTIGTTAKGLGTEMTQLVQDILAAHDAMGQKTTLFDPTAGVKKEATELLSAFGNVLLEPLNNVIAAGKAVIDARRTLEGVNNQLFEQEKQRRFIQEDVTRGAREEFEARLKVKDITNEIRDIDEQRDDIVHAEQNRIRDYAPTLAKMDDDALASTVALDKAKWDIVDAQKALNAAQKAALVDQKVAATISGLSTTALHERLAGVKASLAAQQPLLDFAEKQSQMQDNLTTAQIAQREAERNAVTIPQKRAEFIRQSVIDQREYNEKIDELADKETGLNFQKKVAELELTHLLTGQTGVVDELRKLNITIHNTLVDQGNDQRALYIATQTVRKETDLINGNYADAAVAQINITKCQASAAGLAQSTVDYIGQQINKYKEMIPLLLTISQLIQNSMKVPAATVPLDLAKAKTLRDAVNNATTQKELNQANADVDAFRKSNPGSIEEYDRQQTVARLQKDVTDAENYDKGVIKTFGFGSAADKEAFQIVQTAKQALHDFLKANPAPITANDITGLPNSGAQLSQIIKAAHDAGLDIPPAFVALLQAALPGAHAEGGIISSATRTLVGEAGLEAILPLTKPARLAQLLGDPRVLNPVLAALDTVNLARTKTAGITVSGQNNNSVISARSQDADNERNLLAKAIANELAHVLVSGGGNQVTVHQTVQHTDPELVGRIAVREIKTMLDNL